MSMSVEESSAPQVAKGDRGADLHDYTDVSDAIHAVAFSKPSAGSCEGQQHSSKQQPSYQHQHHRRYKDIWNTVAMAAAAAPASDECVPAGSKGHSTRQCKPCAFFHTQGCQSGYACKFCHLCPPREVQRRKRMRRKVAREQMAREVGWIGNVRERLGKIGQDTAQQLSKGQLVAESDVKKLESLGSRMFGSLVPLNLALMQPTAFQFASSSSDHKRSHQQQPHHQQHQQTEPEQQYRHHQDCDSISDDEPGSPEPFRCITDFLPSPDTAFLSQPNHGYAAMQCMVVPMAMPDAISQEQSQQQQQQQQQQQSNQNQQQSNQNQHQHQHGYHRQQQQQQHQQRLLQAGYSEEEDRQHQTMPASFVQDSSAVVTCPCGNTRPFLDDSLFCDECGKGRA